MTGVKAVFFSTCILGVFLILGKLVRVKLPLLQKLYLPSSIIGGFLALTVGPHGFNLLPTWALEQWAQFPSLLINVVFACLFLGVALPHPRNLWAQGGAQLCYGSVVGFGQYFVALIVTALVLTPMFGTESIFACILEVGFSGGHGTAAGMTGVFTDLGFEEGGPLGQMSATVGLITAVVGGIILVNMAIRRGYTREIKATDNVSAKKRTGLLPEEERFSIATATVAAEAIEPLALHFSIVGISILIGWWMLQGIQTLHPVMMSFPLFPLAMIGGMLVQVVATPMGVAKYFDKDTFDRILGFSLDLLVLSAISTLRLDLFWAHLWPFAILMVAGIAWVLFCTLYLAPRMFPDYWFERAITEYGMQTGVTAIGLLLLRLVDPHYKTGTANAFGFKQMVYEPFMGGGLITATAPIMILNFGVWPSVAICAVIMAAAFLLSYVNGWFRLGGPRIVAQG